VSAAVVAVLLALWGASALSNARAEAQRQARLVDLTKAIAVALPIGSTPAQVVAFLDGRKLGHSEFDAKTRTLYASTAEEQVNPFTRARILIIFHFDETARITNFSVEQGVTGL
jgi:hypothetical protein